MSHILLKDKKYSILSFDSEDDFEKAVIENSSFLFGKDTVYIDVKKKVGKKNKYHKGIPDGYLIDFFDAKSPQLYFIENELDKHDVYGHIGE